MFSLRNNFGDALTFRPQPFIWHFFLSHVQRESSDCCAALALALTELSVRGRRMRAWYDNKAGVLTKEAMLLGIRHSHMFVVFLSPSTFLKANWEIQVGASGWAVAWAVAGAPSTVLFPCAPGSCNPSCCTFMTTY